VQSGTVDELIRAKLLSLRCDRHRIGMGHDSDDPLAEADFATRPLNVTAECVADAPKVDDARGLDAYR
jgi:hypothetical protein